MPYAIRPDESVEAALRRIAREEAQGALDAARGEGALGPRVHEMRKAVKKLRGLLRLLRPVLSGAGREDAALRAAGRALSELRDAAVRLSTVERLTEGMEEGRRLALLAPFRAAAAHHDARADAEMLPAFALVMESLRDRSEAWRLDRDGWGALEPGLRASWRAARKALRKARRDPAPETLHEFRKRAKDHWYQARLLRAAWPALMDPHIAAADDLGELLGQVNDLSVLRDCLDALPLDPGLRQEACDLADLRAAELLARALPLGRRLLADKAEPLADRWGAWWRLRGAEGG